MTLELYNAGIEIFIITHGGISTQVYPGESIEIYTRNDEIIITLLHKNKDKFSPLWYLLNEIFTLEQMRTVLVVDGRYSLKLLCEHAVVKIKEKEFVFHKNTSYQTFVFSTNQVQIKHDDLNVVRGSAILKKARFLYLLGGIKTFLPLSAIALVAWITKMSCASHIALWMWIVLGGIIACFILTLLNYIRSIKFLKQSIDKKHIIQYLSSERKECRKLSDDLVQKHWDVNAGNESYW